MFYKSHDPKNARIAGPQEVDTEKAIRRQFIREGEMLMGNVQLSRKMSEDIKKWLDEVNGWELDESQRTIASGICGFMADLCRQIEQIFPNMDEHLMQYNQMVEQNEHAFLINHFAGLVQEDFASIIHKYFMAKELKNEMASKFGLREESSDLGDDQ